MEGYWEPHTSSIDFCEDNYHFTPYVAELLNSASAVLLIIFPAWSLALIPSPLSRWPRFILCYTSLVLCGFGSVIFHATLKRTTQGLDEVPMIFANLVFVYCIARPKDTHLRWILRPLPLLGMLIVLGSAAIAIYFVFELYAIFFSIFGGECIFLIGLSHWLCFYREVGKNTDVLRRIWAIAVSVYGVGFCFWATDNLACTRLGMGHLHILWHLLGGLGSTMFPLILIALTADAEGLTFVLRWHRGVMPCLEIKYSDSQEAVVHKSSQSQPVDKSSVCSEVSTVKDHEPLLSVLLSAVGAILVQSAVLALMQIGWVVRTMFCRRHDQSEEDDDESAGPSVSFSGCAFWWPYMAGVCQYLFEEFDLTHARIFTTSASAFPVVCAMMDVNPLQWCMVDYPKCLEHWHSRPLCCFLDSTTFLRQLWHGFLPADAHERVNGRLVVSMTQMDLGLLPRLHNKQVTAFQSNDDLIDCLMATINLPGIFFRGLPRRHGQLSIDGAYSQQRRRPGGKTVVVGSRWWASPGKYDIRPSKRLPWLWAVLPQAMERTKHMMRLGYEDARVNHAVFVSRGWRAKAAGPAESLRDKS